MRAVSLPHFLLVLPRWWLVAAVLFLILSSVLLVLVAGVLGEAQAAPVDGPLVGPFRWLRPSVA